MDVTVHDTETLLEFRSNFITSRNRLTATMDVLVQTQSDCPHDPETDELLREASEMRDEFNRRLDAIDAEIDKRSL